MLCYRYFKEARNCYMHGNKVASKALIEAFDNYSNVANAKDLGLKEAPIAINPVLGKPIELSLRGVIGFSAVVIEIIKICDFSLLTDKAAEHELDDRKPTGIPIRTLSTKSQEAMRQVQSVSESMAFLAPDWTQEYEDLLVDKGILIRPDH